MHPQGQTRKLSAEDIPAIVEMDKTFYFDKSRIWPKEIYESLLTNSKYIVYVYDINREVWAYIVCKLDGNNVDAIKLISKPNGSMFAKKLIVDCLEEFKLSGCKKLIGTCPDYLVKYYVDLGGVVVGVRPHALEVGVGLNVLEIIF